MGKQPLGRFRYTVGSGDHTIADNLAAVTKHFPLTADGLFGKSSGRSGVRHIETDSPISTAYEFFNRLIEGYDIIEPISYKDGKRKGCKAYMNDGSVITFRKRSTSDGSPAVDIKIETQGRVKSHKVHFVKKEGRENGE